MTRTGVPLKAAVPRSASTAWSSVRSFRLTPGVRCGHPELHAGTSVSPAVRQAHHAGHHLVGELEAHRNAADPRADLYRLTRREAAGVRVVGVHQQRAALRPLHQALAVVHPRVVAAQVAAADEERARRSGAWRGEQLGLDAGEVPARAPRARGAIRLSGVISRPGSDGSSGPRSMPCGSASSLDDREPLRSAESVRTGRGARGR